MPPTHTHTPPPSRTQVARETVSGAKAMDFHGAAFTNAYRHLSNVILALYPTDPLAAAR